MSPQSPSSTSGALTAELELSAPPGPLASVLDRANGSGRLVVSEGQAIQLDQLRKALVAAGLGENTGASNTFSRVTATFTPQEGSRPHQGSHRHNT